MCANLSEVLYYMTCINITSPAGVFMELLGWGIEKLQLLLWTSQTRCSAEGRTMSAYFVASLQCLKGHFVQISRIFALSPTQQIFPVSAAAAAVVPLVFSVSLFVQKINTICLCQSFLWTILNWKSRNILSIILSTWYLCFWKMHWSSTRSSIEVPFDITTLSGRSNLRENLEN